jgi:hypothetical protein
MVRIYLAEACFFALVIATSQSTHAQIIYLGDETIQGTVESVSKGRIVIKNAAGKTFDVKIQPKDDKGVTLTGGYFIRFPATVKVTGKYAVDSLEKGQHVRLQVELNRIGQSKGQVSEIWQVTTDDNPPGIEAAEKPDHGRMYVSCTIVGEFFKLVNDRLLVKIPRNEFTRKSVLYFQLEEDARVQFVSDDYRRAGPGARVEKAVLARMSTGDLIAKQLQIQVAETTTAGSRVDEKLLLKYRHLSDEPRAPRVVRSKHFQFTTDVSDRQWEILSDKLETMVTLLTAYFDRAPKGAIQGFIVRDLSGWPEGVLKDPAGIAKIRAGAGLCVSQSVGRWAQAVVYSCDDHGVVQHECTHAFCTMTLGSTGPTWLAEGLAEMSQYWKADETSVNVPSQVLNYIKESKPKRTLGEIAVPGRVPAGTWQEYAWRWALCHLLANNPNYSSRFKPLAIALMSKQPNVSFGSVYGPAAKELSFEYDLFLQSLDNGYEARLCAWQWGRKFKPLGRGGRSKVNVAAKYGWQATGLKLSAGQSYDVAAVGEWTIAADGSICSADGDANGRGRLIGVVFNDYKLSAPMELGARKSFVAPVDGDLYLRCMDDWQTLADNDGELTVHLQMTPKQQDE